MTISQILARALWTLRQLEHYDAQVQNQQDRKAGRRTERRANLTLNKSNYSFGDGYLPLRTAEGRKAWTLVADDTSETPKSRRGQKRQSENDEAGCVHPDDRKSMFTPKMSRLAITLRHALLAGLIVMKELGTVKTRNFKREMAVAGDLEVNGKFYPRMQILRRFADIFAGWKFKTPLVVGRGESRMRLGE